MMKARLHKKFMNLRCKENYVRKYEKMAAWLCHLYEWTRGCYYNNKVLEIITDERCTPIPGHLS
jgi:hypothetical protein